VQFEEIEDVALPLYQGGMINQFDFCASAYRKVEGKRGFKWVPIAWDEKQQEPQYLMGRGDYLESEGTVRPFKMVFRDISASTNARTFLAAFAFEVPCGNSLGVLDVDRTHPWTLASVTNSFTFDWVVRRRMGGSHLNLFVVEELPSLRPEVVLGLDQFTRGLLYPSVSFAPMWVDASRRTPWKNYWAVTRHERLRLRAILEVAIAMRFGINETEFREIVRDCDRSIEALDSSTITRSLDTKGFWRFERDLPPEVRLAVISQVAFREALSVGLESFLAQNDGAGWMLPDSLRLADYGLGHDDRAKEHQPVTTALGPRFRAWQLEQSVEVSWEECQRHAEVLAKLLPPPDAKKKTSPEKGDAVAVDLFGVPLETDLFGSPVYPRPRKR
jgi:hypothetical protein